MLFISGKTIAELYGFWFQVRCLIFVSLEGVNCQEERCQEEYKADKMINRQLLLTYLYLLVYILLSSGVILYNKWVLSPKYFNFPFPITLTMIHMGFSGMVAFFLVRVLKVVSPVKMTFEIYVTCVVPISAFFASSLWFCLIMLCNQIFILWIFYLRSVVEAMDIYQCSIKAKF
ncbi:hypothetical protein RHMOL_Rhmol13G0002300 [Rhododendron molle]|uniref:Uncharacterized protein n=1 Tax=Rhododendron molle TaxID=49168 RepID=A0ACC0L1H3_RHOML|nr:hypothetical protein RHMOL_Rhmol13G0002300 [Rhododendron molle]